MKYMNPENISLTGQEAMYKINDRLATHGFNGSARISNVFMKEEDLETGYIEVPTIPPFEKWRIFDVRMLQDGYNDLLEYTNHINLARRILDKEKCVICCEAGQSRSNAIALGVLMTHFHLGYYQALDLINEKVPIAMIDPYHLDAIKKIFSVTLP